MGLEQRGGAHVSVGASRPLGAAFVERCTWHRSPMIDLALIRIRSLAVANAVTLWRGGFYGLRALQRAFLTTVWGYSSSRPGSRSPRARSSPGGGPPASNLPSVSARPRSAAGAIIWAAGVFYLVAGGAIARLPGRVASRHGDPRDRGRHHVPGHRERRGRRDHRRPLCHGHRINSIARQLGAVLGVALLVAIVGTPAPTEIAAAFDSGWIFAAACFTASAPARSPSAA